MRDMTEKERGIPYSTDGGALPLPKLLPHDSLPNHLTLDHRVNTLKESCGALPYPYEQG